MMVSLFISSDMMKPRAAMLDMEQQVVMELYNKFDNGIVALFASYYNFGVYPKVL